MTVKIFYFHGWSYEAHFFYDFAQTIPYISFFYNRGYNMPASAPIINPYDNNIAVTHSMGLFFLLQNYNINDFKKIIILSGFAKFPISPSILTRMQKGLLKNPSIILKEFRKNAGDFSDFETDNFNIPLLIEDLEILKNYDASDILHAYQGRIYTIHGEKDKIVPHIKAGLSSYDHIIISQIEHVFSLKDNIILEKFL